MNDLMIFQGHEVEVFEWHGKVLFNPYHVGTCLELADSSVRNYLASMNELQAVLLKNSDVRNKDIRKLNNAGEKFLTESGVFKLIFKSNKPDAEKFQDWVTDEVLPAIRKHGMYAVDQLLDNPDLAIQAFTALKEEREKNKHLQGEIAQKDQVIAELNPKASYYDVVLQTKDTISTSQIAKDYGKSAVWLNTYLHDKGIQYKQGKTWLLYQKYAEQGYTKSKTHTYSGNDGLQHSNLHTYWTQKGRLFIYDLLKADGILPVMEQIQNGNEAG